MIGPMVVMEELMQSARQAETLHPGLPLTMAHQSPLKGSRYSTEEQVGGEPEMLRFASQTVFQLPEAGCFLVASYLAALLDLQLMDNT